MLLTPVPFFRAGGMELSFFNTSLSTNDNVTFPASIASGDLCVCVQVSAYDATPSAAPTPSGFTSVYSIEGGDTFAARISYKILTGSETTINPTTTGDVENTRTLVFRPTKSIASVTSTTWNSQQTVNSPSLQTVTVASQNPPLIVLGFTASGSSSYNFSTASPAFDNTYGRAIYSGGYWRIGYKIYNSSPSNHSIDINDEGSTNILSSAALVLT